MSYSIDRRLLTLALWAVLAMAPDAGAIPTFARRYEVECSFCHEGFPKLNRQGERFKERGFRLETEDPWKGSAWLRSVPVSVRLEGARFDPKGPAASNFALLKGIAAGNLGTRVSFWIDDAVFVDKEDATHVKPDNAWVRFELTKKKETYLKVGRFELDIPFTQTRTPHLIQYATSAATSGLETVGPFAQYQQGVEVGGLFGRTRASLAAVKSQGDDSFGGVHARVAHRVRGSTKVGALAFLGSQDSGSVRRFGIDGSGWVRRANVYGAALYGSQKDAGLNSSVNSGFVGVDYHLRSFAVLTGRFESTKKKFGRRDSPRLSTFVPGVQLFSPKFARLSFEYDTKTKFKAVQIEATF